MPPSNDNKLSLTPEQDHIIASTRNTNQSLMIDAYAGVGKTTTLALAAPQVRIPALALAFNRSIKSELSERFPANFQVSTMNGLGYGALRRAYPKVTSWKVDDKKLGKLITQQAKELKYELSGDEWDLTRQLTTSAQQRLLLPGDHPDEQGVWDEIADELFLPDDLKDRLIYLARTVLIENNNLTLQGVLSFDDQIYASLVLGGKFVPYPVVFVDEAQDLSVAQHQMLLRSLRPDGRLVACGDARQAIYLFRGADSESLGKIRQLRSDWITLPLSMTFRCPKAIVARQLAHAPGYRAAESNPEGQFMGAPRLPRGEDEAPSWSWSDIPNELTGVAILCRNNAPLLSMAYKLLKRRVSVKMLGRDIGKGLVQLSRKLAPNDETRAAALALALDEWEGNESAKAQAMGRDEKLAGISDRAESLRAVLEQSEVTDAGSLRKALENLFSREDGRVTLSTIHRSKGLEWQTVVHLDPWRVPSRQAKESGDAAALRQEMNLKYVCETRTRGTLIHANAKEFV